MKEEFKEEIKNNKIIQDIIECLKDDYQKKDFGRNSIKLRAKEYKDLNSKWFYGWDLSRYIEDMISSKEDKDFFCVINYYPRIHWLEYGILEDNEYENSRSLYSWDLLCATEEAKENHERNLERIKNKNKFTKKKKLLSKPIHIKKQNKQDDLPF